MYVQMFLAVLGFFMLWVYFYRYKNKPLYFYVSSFTYIVALVFYILTSPYRMGRITSWVESLLT